MLRQSPPESEIALNVSPQKMADESITAGVARGRHQQDFDKTY